MDFLHDGIVFTYTDLKPFIILRKHREEAQAKRLADIEMALIQNAARRLEEESNGGL